MFSEIVSIGIKCKASNTIIFYLKLYRRTGYQYCKKLLCISQETKCDNQTSKDKIDFFLICGPNVECLMILKNMRLKF